MLTTMKSTRILIIDDEPDFTALLRANLEEEGDFMVREINDPQKALDAARLFKPHICVIDVVMPTMDGGDIVAQLRADDRLRHVPVIMLTALVEENTETPSGETMTGGLPFVSKTSGFDSILASIHRHLNQSA